MYKNLGNILKATFINVIVAFLIAIIIIIAINFFLGQKKDLLLTIANAVSVNTEEKKEQKTVLEGNTIKNYPEYGAEYAQISIPKINVNLPVYYGDTMEILKKGVGHSSGSYFPGEGGSIIYMGHNSKKVFREFAKLSKNDEIYVNTSYGNFTYKVYDMKIIKETQVEELPIQKNEEILMVYTCYPFQNIGYTTQRYVIYAKKE